MKIKAVVPVLLALLGLPLVSRVAVAQVDLSANWAINLDEDYQPRFSGPDFVDYAGIPLNEEGRAGSLSYTTATVAEIGRQCQFWPQHYLLLGPFGARMWADLDPITGTVLAWNIAGSPDRAQIVIWMDGREHPAAEAPHTLGGFATGKWEGDTLVATVSHMKAGNLTRNGVPSSDRERLTLYITRHEDMLTIVALVEDPIYLAEPFIMSRTWTQASSNLAAPPAVCSEEEELSSVANGNVPHYLPGKNPALNEVHQRYNIPQEAVMGGPATMYPEYRKQLRLSYTPPKNYCGRYCCGTGMDLGYISTVLRCQHGP
jgi:hypothetical protein